MEEQQNLEAEKRDLYASSDPTLIEAALSGRKLKKGSRYRNILDREAELPGLIFSLQRHILTLKIDTAKEQLPKIEEERIRLNREAQEAQDALLEAPREVDMAQSLASAAQFDRNDLVRKINSLENQLASLEAPSSDRLERELAAKRVWREG